MFMRALVPWLLLLVGSLAAGCGSSGEAPAAETKASEGEAQAAPAASTPVAARPAAAQPSAEQPVQHPDPSLPVAKRMLGKWRMDLDKVPDAALTEEFRKLKKQGKAKQLLITYTVTDTEFSMETFGNGSIWRTRFDYEILRESGDALVLKKTDEQGKQSEVGVVLKEDDQLFIGTGNGAVPLQRIALPEPKR
jgi:hypothetical protein